MALACSPFPLVPPFLPSVPTCCCLLTGSESDLRKLSQKDAVRILLDFGITQEQVNKVTDRWKRIDWIRRLCTAAAADGIFNDLTRK
jgi:hypothetical protein